MALRLRLEGSPTESAAGVYAVMAFIGLIALVLVGVCLFFIGMGAYQAVRQERLLRSAVETPATITASRVEASTFATGSSRGGGQTRATTHRPVVEFTYEVNGQTYAGDRVFPVPQSGSTGWAQQVVACFAPGQTVTALVDPSDPANAFLRRDRVYGPYYGIGVGVVSLLILGAIGAFIAIRLRRHLAAQQRESAQTQPTS